LMHDSMMHGRSRSAVQPKYDCTVPARLWHAPSPSLFSITAMYFYATLAVLLPADITTSLSCPFIKGGQFCAVRDDPASDVPAALPAGYNSWHEPFCADVPPPGEDAWIFRRIVQGARAQGWGR
jgi:hypothetical protein